MSGKCTDTNDNAKSVIDNPDSFNWTGFMSGWSHEKDKADDVIAAVKAGESRFGKIGLSVSGKKTILEGGFSAVKGADGTVEQVIFLGADITAAETAMRETQEMQARVSEEQNQVVSALGESLRKLADGDLSAQIDNNFPADYEKLRADFNNTVSSLADAVLSVTQNARVHSKRDNRNFQRRRRPVETDREASRDVGRNSGSA